MEKELRLKLKACGFCVVLPKVTSTYQTIPDCIFTYRIDSLEPMGGLAVPFAIELKTERPPVGNIRAWKQLRTLNNWKDKGWICSMMTPEILDRFLKSLNDLTSLTKFLMDEDIRFTSMYNDFRKAQQEKFVN